MAWYEITWNWLVQTALGDLLVLIAGSLAVQICRQPVRRLRLIALTLTGCAIVPCVGQVPGVPRWSVNGPAHVRNASREPGNLPGATTTAAAVEVVTASPITNLPVTASLSIAPPDRAKIVPLTLDIAAWIGSLPFRPMIIVAYTAAAIGLLSWWLSGQLMLVRLYVASSPASETVVELFRKVAGPGSDRVCLLQSERIVIPCTFTGWRSVIFLPAGFETRNDAKSARFCLAHEWSHIERRDCWTWNGACLVGLVAFYQPLFWWLRRELRLCQDYLADARAVEHAPDPEDYADYLLDLAQRRLARPSLPALGIGDRRSNLYRRIVMLVEARQPLDRRCGRTWTLAASAGAAVLVLISSSLRIDAGMRKWAPIDSPSVSEQPPAPAPSTPAKAIVGRVRDKVTGKPIAGAKVIVRLSTDQPASLDRKTLTKTSQTTSAEGTYRFMVTPEQLAEPSLLVDVDVQHPGYVRVRRGVKLKGKNLATDAIFDDTMLERGKAIEARLLTPDGNPAVNVKIGGYTTPHPMSPEYRKFGSFTQTATGADGRFRLDLFPSGPAVYWILPTDYALSTHLLKNDRRGDLGTITLVKGNAIQGNVLGIKGKPVAGVYVQADRVRPNEFREAGLMGIADSITRSVVTDSEGKFTIRALPAGDYRVTVVEEGRDPATRNDVLARRPLPAVFPAREVTIDDGNSPEPLVIRAIPHVVIEAQVLDSKGKRCPANDWSIHGRIEGIFWSSPGRPDASGRLVIRAPLGLEIAQLNVRLARGSTLRYRLFKDAPLESGRDIDLETLDHDIRGIEIIRYEAPVAAVNVVSEDGQKPKNVQISAEYFAVSSRLRGRIILPRGVRSDIAFEQEKDGRFRSRMLLPDEKFKLTVTADGFEPRSDILSLPEGITREVTFILKRK